MLFAILLPLLCIGASNVMGEEPKCSRFEFEKNLLEMLVRTEFKLKQTIEKLTLTEEIMKTEIEELKQNDGKMTTELAAFAVREEAMKTETQELATEFAVREEAMKTEIQELAAALADFKDNSTKISQELNDTLSKEMEDSIKRMENKLANQTSSSTVPRIYFFVTQPESNLGSNDRPIFTGVLHNEGNSYDTAAGLFICRVPGLYHFAFGFSSHHDSYAYCWIYRNGNHLVHAYARERYNSGSIAAYLHLDVGNTVEIMCPTWTKILHDTSMWYTGAFIKS